MSGSYDKEALISSVTNQDYLGFIKIGRIMEWTAAQMNKMFSDHLPRRAPNPWTVKRWVTLMNQGRTVIEDTRGGPNKVTPDKDERIARIKDCLAETRSWSVRELSHRLNIPSTTVWEILRHDLDLTKKLGKLVPHHLTEDQRQARIDVCYDNLLRVRRHPNLLKKVLAIDESWVSLYRPPSRNKRGSWLGPNEKAPNVPQQELRERKRMMIMAMDFDGIAFWHLCDENESVNSEVYKTFLETYVPKWMEGKRFKGPVICHDNARPHKSKMIMEFLAKNQFDTLGHPPYSPDVHPCDYDCFSHLKAKISGIRYKDWKSLENAINTVIQDGLQNGHFKGVTKLPDRWERVIAEEGNYI